MSAPAVPQNDSGRTAPTTHIESTDVAPFGQSVSAIGTGGPSSSDGAIYSGAYNSIDMYFRMQFIALASFVWNTTQSPGTLLWSIPISPKQLTPHIRHLAKMYNTWVGGFNFNFKVCGTGFHSGAIAIVRLPPNITPSSISSPSEFSVFEYVIIDPKTLEVVSEHIIDQRNKMYHYMDDEGRDAIGGHIAVYVLAPLATSSTGNQNITIQVLARPSMDFNFFQIKPIAAEGSKEDDDPVEIPNALNSSICNKGTGTFGTPVKNIIISPKSVNLPLASLNGCYKFDGTHLGNATSQIFPIPEISYSLASSPQTNSIAPDFLTGLPLATGSVSLNLAGNFTGSEVIEGTSTSMKGPGLFNFSGAVTGSKSGYFRLNSWLEATRNVPAKLNEESFVLFENPPTEGDNARRSFQTAMLAELLKSKNFANIMNNQQSMIVDCYDADLDTPVRRFRVSYNGIITTKGEDNEIALKANKYYFKFVQYTRISEPIPAPPKDYDFNAVVSKIHHSTV